MSGSPGAFSHLADSIDSNRWAGRSLTRSTDRRYNYDVLGPLTPTEKALNTGVFLAGMASRSVAMFCG